ncbi:MAG: hypothetical protein ACI9MB_002493, partial [Verrucomicrobiales bacterium]
ETSGGKRGNSGELWDSSAHRASILEGAYDPSRVRNKDGIADVCLVLDGTYPYISGGVST